MEQQNIKTSRCVLRPATVEDATWMFRLFNDEAVVAYIEGIQWFNKDIESTVGFIKSMEVNSRRETGMLWSIIYNENPVGFIMVNDLDDNPFLTFALFPEYRRLHLGTEVYKSVNRYISERFTSPKIETKNPIVKKILRHSAEILFIYNII